MSPQEGGFILSLPKLISKGFFLESVQLAAHSVGGRASEMPKVCQRSWLKEFVLFNVESIRSIMPWKFVILKAIPTT